ncbi:minor histocompatibility antigen H13-like [Halichondria panicea]|uniref:minor histocompatibility antigen H13-like n=1 Tax=Halichondria panicea TaxID=6063 RepID=UPI00312BA8D3
MSTELEDNATLLEDIVSNETNMTGRGAATPQGIALTYASLFLMALGPIVLGAFRSVHYHSGLKKRGEEASDRIAMRDAATFPLYASAGLFGLYIFFKFIPREYVSLTLRSFFLILGISGLARACSALLDPFIPEFITSRLTSYHLRLTVKPPRGEQEESSFQFHTGDIVMAVGALIVGITYFFTNQWLLNNMFGLAFSLNAIELISLDSISVGCLLLGGLFVYDIFWVFGTDVMVTVAKGLDAPIKLMFPMDFLEKGLAAQNFGMLGLGDIVVPGLFIALLCRFDYQNHPSKCRVYFYTGFVAYIIGLGTTIAVMHVFNAAQPALLYLVPSCLGLPFLVALIRGDLSDLLKYKDYPDKPAEEKSKNEESSKDSKKHE